MLDKIEIYNKIKAVYPDIGEYDKDLQIDFDQAQHVWVVDLRDGRKHLKTYLEEVDAEACVGKNKCFGLGIQIGQLRDNLKDM
ncbi:MAG: hypothetical protein WC799_21585 [Desulfobacteraceae bacterium]|jgi:hypothetical protein